MTTPLPPADLRARVLAAAAAEPAAVRGSWWRNLPVVAAAFLPAIGLSIYIQGPGLGRRPIGYAATITVAWLLVAVMATYASVSRGKSMLGRSHAWRFATAALTPVALLAAAMLAMLLWPEAAVGGTSWASHRACIIASVLCAVGPLACLAFLGRRGDAVSPGLSGAAIGAAAGAWGAVFIELHCTRASVAHVVVGHLLPVALVTIVGVIVGDRVLAIRARA